ncbi:MAG: circadian clock KaiB family protein [Nitrospiria bacterium]
MKHRPLKSLDVEIVNTPSGADREPDFVLRLYVTGTTPQSTRAIANLKRVCDRHLRGRYHLTVIDIYQQPHLATNEQIIATPTLLKQLPLPVRRLIGDMTDEERLLIGLDLPAAGNNS